jgi:hypothetical protein
MQATRETDMAETYEAARGSDGLHRWRRQATRLVLVTAAGVASLDGGVK